MRRFSVLLFVVMLPVMFAPETAWAEEQGFLRRDIPATTIDYNTAMTVLDRVQYFQQEKTGICFGMYYLGLPHRVNENDMVIDDFVYFNVDCEQVRRYLVPKPTKE